jgi:hypothetical protein
MKQKKDKSAVIKGILYPSDKDIKAVVASLQRKVRKDPKMAQEFKRDPRRFLVGSGLNEDVQGESLREMGLKARDKLALCFCTGCCTTCWCTDCCITEINITRLVQ